MREHPSTIDALLRLRAAHDGAKPAVVDRATRITYRELDATTRDLAAVFVDAGVRKGTRVGLIMPNSVRWVQIALALTRIGAVLVPLSTLLQPRELLAQLHTASVQALSSVQEFRGHRYLDDLRSVDTKLPALRHVWLAGRLAQATADEAAARIADSLTATVTPSDPMVIMFTSGSSGPRRGSCTHTAMRWTRSRRASRRVASTATPGCTCRCRSSGSAASAAESFRRC